MKKMYIEMTDEEYEDYKRFLKIDPEIKESISSQLELVRDETYENPLTSKTQETKEYADKSRMTRITIVRILGEKRSR